VPLRSLLMNSILALGVIGSSLPPVTAIAQEAPSAVALMAEVRRSFTLNGKAIPPEVFRDFGDGDLADSGNIWVTVDLKTAIGSNLYFDEIKQDGRWLSQRKAGSDEEIGYTHKGTTDNGLLVVLAIYNSGGTGRFTHLHILDIAPARAFDFDGNVYERLNLTNLRTIPLGDRWGGEVSVEKNTITIVTTRTGPADDSGERRRTTIEARRP
jgi:hypothetical protein